MRKTKFVNEAVLNASFDIRIIFDIPLTLSVKLGKKRGRENELFDGDANGDR